MRTAPKSASWLVVLTIATSVSVVLAALVAVTELDIAPISSSTPPSTEWFSLPRDRALLLALVCTLGVCTVTSGWNDLDRRRSAVSEAGVSGTTVAATLLVAGWAALPVALWSSQSWVRGAAFACAAVIPVALAHQVHSALRVRTARPSRRGSTPVGGTTAWTAAYLLVVVLAVLHGLADEPFRDLRCLEFCEPATPPLESPALARVTDVALRTAATTGAVLTVVLGTVVLSRTDRRTDRVTGLAAVLAGGVEAVWALGPVAGVVVGPGPVGVPSLMTARLLGHGAVALSVIALVVLAARNRVRLRRMAREIVAATPPNSVRGILARRLDDPGARIEYAVDGDGPSRRQWVDENGRPVEESGEPARQVALVSRDGRPVARVRFAGPARAADLEDALGPAAVLALEAERSRAELLMRLSALHDLRRRVVEESDGARRRAERDLHDGAQHLLLAATFAIQEGLQEARAGGDERATESLEHALADVTGIAADLRAVAHGMYPVLLGDAGLVPALEGLARSSSATVSIDADPVERVDPSVELTLYQACAVAVRSTTEDAPDALAIGLRRDPGTLRLTMAGPQLPQTTLEPLRDRVAALGGRMESNAGSVVMEVPCG